MPGEKGAGSRNGRFYKHARGATAAASFRNDAGGWQRNARGRFRLRRVVVKARVVKLNPGRSGHGRSLIAVSRGSVSAHLRYLERDGVTKDGGKGCVYSAHDDEADGRAFIRRGREDRHQFRFIVSPEDAADLPDMRALTRNLMTKMEEDLETGLDWVAIDHQNTGHPHTHILLRDVTEDGKTLSIAGRYMTHGIRYRASELMTLELGPQTEIEAAAKLTNECDAERLTRPDRMLIAEEKNHGLVDLRPNARDNDAIYANRYRLIDRARKLERLGLAMEITPGQWDIPERTEGVLRALGRRGAMIETIDRALSEHGLEVMRGRSHYFMHGVAIKEPIVGRVLAKGGADDAIGERFHAVIDGVDGLIHHVETDEAQKLEEIERGQIVALAPARQRVEPRASDRNIAIVAAEDGIYRPDRHLAAIRDIFLAEGKDPEAFVRSHLRRLDALRRAGHVEPINGDDWRIPPDLAERGMAYDMKSRVNGFIARLLSAFDLEAQIGSDGAGWLDRQLSSRNPVPLRMMGFGMDVTRALDQRASKLIEMGLAARDAKSGRVIFAQNLVQRLEEREVTRVGHELALKHGKRFVQAGHGDDVRGTLTGAVNLMSGRYGVIDNGFELRLVPSQPVLEKRVDHAIAGFMRKTDGIDWDFGKTRELGIGP